MEIKVSSKSQFKRLSIDSRRQTPMQKCKTLDVLRIPEQLTDTQLRQAKKSSSPSSILDQLLENASLLS